MAWTPEERAEAVEENSEEIVSAYESIIGVEYATKEGLDESYVGEYSSDEEFAKEMADQTGAVIDDLAWPNYCIDWERAARELMMDYTEEHGHYFYNY